MISESMVGLVSQAEILKPNRPPCKRRNGKREASTCKQAYSPMLPRFNVLKSPLVAANHADHLADHPRLVLERNRIVSRIRRLQPQPRAAPGEFLHRRLAIDHRHDD